MEQNQAPTRITLFEPGSDRRVALLVDRGNTDNLVPGTGISMDKYHEYQLVGRRLQARAMASAFKSLFRGVASSIEKLAGAYRRARTTATAIRELGSLDDSLLQDIGIRRERIPSAVAGLMAQQTLADAAPAKAAPAKAVLEPGGQQAACNDPHAQAAA